MPKMLPKNVSNYEELVEYNCYYVDKTKYIERLENLEDRRVMALRPRKFGKSLFVSTLGCYYDINKKDKFNKLFGETYIGKNPTPRKNSYHILKFNFSGISTNSNESTMKGFKREVATSIELFVKKYGMDFYVNEEQDAEDILDSLIKSFQIQKPEGKIYVIIDEYDHFANELLSFHTEDFKNLVSREGKIRKWYEILKKGTETVVEKIFITGVAPITLDSLTSGFNVSADLTRDVRFNEMFGFTEEELTKMLKEQDIAEEKIEELLPIMRENYDGYKFNADANTKIYNSNMCLNFLAQYMALGKMPAKLMDPNIASDYEKIASILLLYKGGDKEQIIENAIAGEGIVSDITDKFNFALKFDEKDMISMLFYVGYLTIVGSRFGLPELKIPNKVMKEVYSEYFLEILRKETEIQIDSRIYTTMLEELAYEGKIDTLVKTAGEYMNKLSNRDFMRFDEKYVKLIFFCMTMNMQTAFFVKSEMEVQRKYPDLLLVPKEKDKGYYSAMIEFKYLKKDEENKLKEKQEEAKKQIQEYAEFEEIKGIEKLKCYTIVAVNDKLYVEEV